MRMTSPGRATVATTLLFFMAACGATMPPSERHPLAPVGIEAKPLPKIHRPTLRGDLFDSTGARGKVIVVKFFAKYCEPCKASLPWVQKLAAERTDVVVVGIGEDEHASDVAEVARAFDLTFPIVHDSGNVLAGRFRVSDLPVTFVADSTGRIRWVGGPGQTEEALRDAVSAARP